MGRRKAARNAYTHHIGLAKYCDNPWISGDRRPTVTGTEPILQLQVSSRLQLFEKLLRSVFFFLFSSLTISNVLDTAGDVDASGTAGFVGVPKHSLFPFYWRTA